jgi:hypothetical protein
MYVRAGNTSARSDLELDRQQFAAGIGGGLAEDEPLAAACYVPDATEPVPAPSSGRETVSGSAG